jgi:hypothetical protein
MYEMNIAQAGEQKKAESIHRHGGSLKTDKKQETFRYLHQSKFMLNKKSFKSNQAKNWMLKGPALRAQIRTKQNGLGSGNAQFRNARESFDGFTRSRSIPPTRSFRLVLSKYSRVRMPRCATSIVKLRLNLTDMRSRKVTK